MDSSHIRHKWSLPWGFVSHRMTFDLDLQGLSTITLQWNCYNMAHLAVSTLQHVQSGWILSIFGTNDHQHERVCCTQWPLTLTYIFRLFSCDIIYLMDCMMYIHMWHKDNPWGDDVSGTISRSIGQRIRSHESFEFLKSGQGYLSRSLIYNF